MRARGSCERDRDTATAALLLVQICVGYEWLVSGLTKVVHGDFATGLGAQLHELAKSAPSWYGSFLSDAVVPHSQEFAYAVEAAELVAGAMLLGAGIALLVRGGRLSARVRHRLRLVTAAASLLGLVLVVNFELANGGTFGLSLAKDSFDEGVDLDTIMAGLQLALLVFGLTGRSARVEAARRRPPAAKLRAV